MLMECVLQCGRRLQAQAVKTERKTCRENGILEGWGGLVAVEMRKWNALELCEVSTREWVNSFLCTRYKAHATSSCCVRHCPPRCVSVMMRFEPGVCSCVSCVPLTYACSAFTHHSPFSYYRTRSRIYNAGVSLSVIFLNTAHTNRHQFRNIPCSSAAQTAAQTRPRRPPPHSDSNPRHPKTTSRRSELN